MADEAGTVVADDPITTDDMGSEEVAPVADAPAAETPAEPVAAAPAKPVEEQFIDPSTLPPEIKAHWTRMHGTYNKKLAEVRDIAARRPDIEFLDRFRTDQEFAKQVLLAEASRLGVTLNGASNGATKPATTAPASGGDGPPPELVERIRSRLAPELQWMADQQAATAWEAIQFSEAPKAKQAQEAKAAEYRALYAQEAEKLATAAPGWEAHEKDMSELLGFMASAALTHPRFGSKLEILHRLVRPDNGTARVDAIRSMGEAARNATRTGQSTRSTTSNVPDRVRKAATPREAMQIAAEEAERELRAAGIAVPD